MWAPRRSPCVQGTPWARSDPAITPRPRKSAPAQYQRDRPGRAPQGASPHRRDRERPQDERADEQAPRRSRRRRRRASGTASARTIAPRFQAASWARTMARGGGSVARKAPAKNWLAPRTSCETPPTKARWSASQWPQGHGWTACDDGGRGGGEEEGDAADEEGADDVGRPQVPLLTRHRPVPAAALPDALRPPGEPAVQLPPSIDPATVTTQPASSGSRGSKPVILVGRQQLREQAAGDPFVQRADHFLVLHDRRTVRAVFEPADEAVRVARLELGREAERGDHLAEPFDRVLRPLVGRKFTADLAARLLDLAEPVAAGRNGPCEPAGEVRVAGRPLAGRGPLRAPPTTGRPGARDGLCCDCAPAAPLPASAPGGAGPRWGAVRAPWRAPRCWSASAARPARRRSPPACAGRGRLRCSAAGPRHSDFCTSGLCN